MIENVNTVQCVDPKSLPLLTFFIKQIVSFNDDFLKNHHLFKWYLFTLTTERLEVWIVELKKKYDRSLNETIVRSNWSGDFKSNGAGSVCCDVGIEESTHYTLHSIHTTTTVQERMKTSKYFSVRECAESVWIETMIESFYICRWCRRMFFNKIQLKLSFHPISPRAGGENAWRRRLNGSIGGFTGKLYWIRAG